MEQTGAILDRGYVRAAAEDGTCRIEGIGRKGVLTLPMPLPSGIQPGDMVVYVEFLDGACAILQRIG